MSSRSLRSHSRVAQVVEPAQDTSDNPAQQDVDQGETETVPPRAESGDVPDAPAHVTSQDEEMLIFVDPDTRPARRGRPPKKPKETAKVFDSEKFPVESFSLTYGRKGDHMPLMYHTTMNEYLNEYAVRASNSTERGGKKEHLHGQAIFEGCAGTTKEHIASMVKEMKEAMGVRWGDGSGAFVHVKPFGIGQTVQRMLGYIHKDDALPHFRNWTKGYTAEQIEKGKEEWVSLKLDYMDDKIAINRSNLFKVVYTYYNNYLLDDPHVTLACVVAQMLNSKKYMFSPAIVMSGNGQMRTEAAETYWAIIKGDIVATEHDAKKILYLPVQTFGARRMREWQEHVPQDRGVSEDDTPVRPSKRAQVAELGDFVPLHIPPVAQTDAAVADAPSAGAGSSGILRQAIAEADSDDDESPVRRTTAYDRIRKVLTRRKNLHIMSDSDADDDEANDDEEPTPSDEEFIVHG